MPPKQSSKKKQDKKSTKAKVSQPVETPAPVNSPEPSPPSSPSPEPPSEQPSVQPSEPLSPPVRAESPDSKNSGRKQLSKSIGIELPVSRIRKRLDVLGINSVYTKACKEIKEATEYSPETKALFDEAHRVLSEKDNKVEPSTEACVEYITKKRYRFSSDAAVAMSTILDYLLRQAMLSSIRHAQEKSESKVSWYVDEKLSVRCLLRQSSETDESTTDFYYINNMYKFLRGAETSPRITNEFRTTCSDMVASIIKRFVPLIVMFANASKLKTVNENTIMFVLKFLVADAGGDSTEIEAYTQEKLALFRDM
jgi:hypothetical protein